jgi:hypothetical protein
MSQTFKRQGYCERCQNYVLGERVSGMSDGMGCLLIVLTAGLFIPVFLFARIIGEFRQFLCPHCGSGIGSSVNVGNLVVLLVFAAIIIGLLIAVA